MGQLYRGPRVLVIGLDGATSRLLSAWQQAGLLPNLARLSRRGATGALRSTIRPESSVAWSSFATGLNPGRHGIFGFAGHQLGSYRTRLMTAADLQAPTFWDHAAACGVRVGLYNIPIVTYPPRPLPSGSFSVGGLMTPGLHADFTWPPELKPELMRHIPGYRLDVEPSGTEDAILITAMEELTRMNLAAARWLIEHRSPDLFVAVFLATDRIQHYLWRHLDPSHPRHDAARSPLIASRILASYQQLDDAVGELAALADPDGLIVVLSDHGFNGCHRALSINTWLAENSGSTGEAWLTVRAGSASRMRRASWWRNLRHVPGLRRLKSFLPGLRNVSFERAWRLDPNDWVDWPRTRAYFSRVGGIQLNLQGREPEGVVTPREYESTRDEIADGLLMLQDPQSGSQPIAAVYRREELYHGPYLELAPDLIVEPRRDAVAASDNYLLAHGVPQPGALFSAPPTLTGNHDLDGILIAAGPTVTPGPIAGAHIWDVAPTLTHALGIPIMADLDGRILPGLIRPEGVTQLSPFDPLKSTVSNGLDPEDEDAVAERLRALGYLD